MIERSVSLGRALSDDWVIADGLKMSTIEHLTAEDLVTLGEVNRELRSVADHLGNGFLVAWATRLTGWSTSTTATSSRPDAS